MATSHLIRYSIFEQVGLPCWESDEGYPNGGILTSGGILSPAVSERLAVDPAGVLVRAAPTARIKLIQPPGLHINAACDWSKALQKLMFAAHGRHPSLSKGSFSMKTS